MMENCPVDELLSSFASDAFAIQSQPEKDLRASLINFFSVGHDPNGLNYRKNTIGSSPFRLSNQGHPSPSRNLPSEATMLTREVELARPNTPIGGPTKEGLFSFSTPSNHHFTPNGSYEDCSSLVINNVPATAMKSDSTRDQYGVCYNCFHLASLQQPNSVFQHHHPHCPLHQLDSHHNQPLENSNSLNNGSASTQLSLS